jgi:hypothetical protein
VRPARPPARGESGLYDGLAGEKLGLLGEKFGDVAPKWMRGDVGE